MIKSEVYEKGNARFNMCGQSLPKSVYLTNDNISQGTCSRLVKYATTRIKDAGLDMVLAWDCVVSTLDHDEPPADRFYCVNWTNKQGTRISVEGILTSKGYPHIDHGIHITEDQ